MKNMLINLKDHIKSIKAKLATHFVFQSGNENSFGLGWGGLLNCLKLIWVGQIQNSFTVSIDISSSFHSFDLARKF